MTVSTIRVGDWVTWRNQRQRVRTALSIPQRVTGCRVVQFIGPKGDLAEIDCGRMHGHAIVRVTDLEAEEKTTILSDG
jgi:hypothetical protein